MFEIDWQIKNRGETDIVFNRSELMQKVPETKKDQPVPHLSQDGRLVISPNCEQITGVVQLQGRANHNNIVIQSSSGEQTTTNNNGEFTIASQGSITATHTSYLTAITSQAGDVGQITLLAGDINADNKIDIFDLSYIGAQYGNSQAQADLNNDGLVNILDVALAGNNYNQQGPQTNWQ